MRVSLEKDGSEIVFGKDLVLERLELDPLVYNGEYPNDPVYTKRPNPRYVKLEGYIVPDGKCAADRIYGTMLRRQIIDRICAPGGNFKLKIGDRYAACENGAVRYIRSAPFSGGESEHFVLSAKLGDGYFYGKTVRLEISESITGMSFPGHVLETGSVFGNIGDLSYISGNNSGDTEVGFTALIVPSADVSSFKMSINPTGEFISCDRGFSAGDEITISTLRDDPRFAQKNGQDFINLTGHTSEDSTLFTLPPGEFEISFSGGSFSGYLEYRETFISA